MLSITPEFDMNAIDRYIQEQGKAFLDGLMEDYRRAGRKHVEKIRAKVKFGPEDKSTFGNITWNLRSSIGYIILYNGEIIEDYFPVLQGGTEGAETGKRWAEEVGLMVKEDGVQLVIVAGMDYAVFVQSKGYDVIDFASEQELPKILMEEIG